MQASVLVLGTECRDKATKLTGTLTNWVMQMGGRVDYLFQPRGLNEEGQPIQKIYLVEERLVVKAHDYESVDVPFEILGTQVTNKASGFTGMAVAFVRHINGCFHIDVQPVGRLDKKKRGGPIASHNFDLRELTGDMIPVLTDTNRKESLKTSPSPSGIPRRKSYT